MTSRLNKYDDADLLETTVDRVVIINCGTKWVTSLAYASAYKHVRRPIVIINCGSRDGSEAHFEQLARALDIYIDWVEWPLRPHPIALDDLFRRVPAQHVLLMDSDVEICTPKVFQSMTTALDRNPDAYGSGFMHGPQWFGDEHGLPAHTAYYASRMWIPLVYMRTQAIRSALNAGRSFLNRREYFEVPMAPRLSRLLALRFRIAGLRNIPFPRIGNNFPEREGAFPKFIEYDTGADLHAYLVQSGLSFEQVPEGVWGDVRHHHGVTRAKLLPILPRLAKALRLTVGTTERSEAEVREYVVSRLEANYGVYIGGALDGLTAAFTRDDH
jgi:glycosyltransferase involved in cell wall biosynthesis